MYSSWFDSTNFKIASFPETSRIQWLVTRIRWNNDVGRFYYRWFTQWVTTARHVWFFHSDDGNAGALVVAAIEFYDIDWTLLLLRRHWGRNRFEGISDPFHEKYRLALIPKGLLEGFTRLPSKACLVELLDSKLSFCFYNVNFLTLFVFCACSASTTTYRNFVYKFYYYLVEVHILLLSYRDKKIFNLNQ